MHPLKIDRGKITKPSKMNRKHCSIEQYSAIIYCFAFQLSNGFWVEVIWLCTKSVAHHYFVVTKKLVLRDVTLVMVFFSCRREGNFFGFWLLDNKFVKLWLALEDSWVCDSAFARRLGIITIDKTACNREKMGKTAKARVTMRLT